MFGQQGKSAYGNQWFMSHEQVMALQPETVCCMLAWSRGVSSTAAASWEDSAAAAGTVRGGCERPLPGGAPV